MTGKVVNENPAASLILIFPVAAAIIFLYEAWLYLLGLVLVIVAWRVWDNYQWQQWSAQVNPLFNQLVKENQGCLTPLDLTLKGNLSGSAARRFLERKAEEYGAYRRQLQDQSVVYYFISASTLGNIFDASEFTESDLNLNRLPASANAAVVLEPPAAKFPLASPSAVPTTAAPTTVPETVPQPEQVSSPPNPAPAPIVTPTPSHNAIAQLAQIKEARQQETLAEILSPATQPTESINPITAAILATPEPDELEVVSPEQLTDSPLPAIAAEPEVDTAAALAQSLIQADLAKRLDTTSSTIARRKSDPEFQLWSQSKDPEGIAWQYLEKEKVFVPISE